MRIGVFGGTFDPPHVGHLLLAADACDALSLQRLVFVPAAAQPFKVDAPAVATPADRLEMISLATRGDSRYAVENTEIRREGLSYTVDTLEEIARNNEGAELFLLIGRDTLAGFDGWKRPDRIRQLATLAVMERGDSNVSGRKPSSDGIVVISTRRVDVSSTEIRKRLAGGKSIRGFVPEPVERYIAARGLYR
ncbi:MAG TPA: nicotinate-nucleotide adenylyltransferase [Gemmatimonadaceae bacterium]|nr:nicotinate-nucleotide adenylyltransferase [Gemmatimonadaceae bacterium]